MRRTAEGEFLRMSLLGTVSLVAALGVFACSEEPQPVGRTEKPTPIETAVLVEGAAGTPIAIPAQILTEETETAVDFLETRDVDISVPSLTDIVANPEEAGDVRYWAAVALGGLGDRSASAALLELLEHENPDLRYAAVISLGRLGVESAVPSLSEALNDRDAAVRSVAVQALSHVGGRDAVAALIGKVADADEGDEAIRYEAAVRLGRMMAEGAQEALLKELDNESAVLRRGAAIALADLGNQAAIPVLVGVLRDRTAGESEVVDAILGLEQLTGLEFGYPKPFFASATAQERSEAIRGWIDWWESQ